MKYKVILSWHPYPINTTETVDAEDENEAQGLAVSLASAIHETHDDLGEWVVEEVHSQGEEDGEAQADTYTPYARTSDDELYVSYSSGMVSFSQDVDHGAPWTSMAYTSYGNFGGEINLVVSGESESDSSESDGYTPYLTATSDEAQSDYVPYGSVTTPASNEQAGSLTASQVAGYTVLSAPPAFRAACSYHRTLPNGYLPYKSSWIVAVRPGQTITA